MTFINEQQMSSGQLCQRGQDPQQLSKPVRNAAAAPQREAQPAASEGGSSSDNSQPAASRPRSQPPREAHVHHGVPRMYFMPYGPHQGLGHAPYPMAYAHLPPGAPRFARRPSHPHLHPMMHVPPAMYYPAYCRPSYPTRRPRPEQWATEASACPCPAPPPLKRQKVNLREHPGTPRDCDEAQEDQDGAADAALLGVSDDDSSGGGTAVLGDNGATARPQRSNSGQSAVDDAPVRDQHCYPGRHMGHPTVMLRSPMAVPHPAMAGAWPACPPGVRALPRPCLPFYHMPSAAAAHAAHAHWVGKAQAAMAMPPGVPTAAAMHGPPPPLPLRSRPRTAAYMAVPWGMPVMAAPPRVPHAMAPAQER